MHAIGVVNLARLTGANDILPMALYRCCSLTARDLVEGFRREDGSQESFSSADLAACFQAASVLTREHVGRITGLYKPLALASCTKQTCAALIEAMPRQIVQQCERLVHPRALAGWTWPSADGADVSLCSGCLSALKEREAIQRQDIWNRLPQITGVHVGEN